MTKPPLGRLTQVDLRTYWQREDTEFTPWLGQSENLDLLGAAIGKELERQAEEVNVGPFRADLLCKDTVTGDLVLVENQIERTDHGHLGQVLTYAAGLGAKPIVWIAREFQEEHRAALDWLNESTHDDIEFYGVQVELWRIGDSTPAPRFDVVAHPNEWSREVREHARAAGPLSEPDLGHAIPTQADTLEELRVEVLDAVRCHFEDDVRPSIVRLHAVRDEVLPV